MNDNDDDDDDDGAMYDDTKTTITTIPQEFAIAQWSDTMLNSPRNTPLTDAVGSCEDTTPSVW